jgi:hypothetical protein
MGKDRVVQGLMGVDPNSTQFRIWKILFYQYHLRRKGIQTADILDSLERRYNKVIKRQAVESHLAALVKSNWVIKIGEKNERKYYKPSKHWISLLAGTFTRMDDDLSEDEEKERTFNGLYGEYIEGKADWKEFTSLADFELWLIGREKKIKRAVASEGNHLWWYQTYKEECEEMMRTVSLNVPNENSVIGVCSEKTNIAIEQVKGSRQLALNLDRRPEQVGLGISSKAATNPYLYVAGDYVHFALYPDEVNSKVSEYFNECRKIDQLPLKELEQLLNDKHRVIVSTLESRAIAMKVRNNIEEHFKKRVRIYD